ncbi:MAG: MFS transporter [Actinomycetota bacterium]
MYDKPPVTPLEGAPLSGMRYTPRHRVPKRDPKVRILRPLRITDFALLWSGLTISLIGDGMFFVALPLQVFALRNTETAYTVALLAWTLPLVALLPVSGILSDRFERRRMMLIAHGIQGVAIALLGILSVAGALELWHVYALAVAYGCGEALFGPAFSSIVPDIVPQNMLVEANSLDNFSRPFALRVAGPALGGLAVALFGTGGAFLFDAATFGIAGIAFALITTRKRTHRSESSFAWQELKDGFSFVRTHKWLLAGLLSAALGLLLFYGPWQALVPYRVTHGLGGDERDIAAMLAVGGIGAIIASLTIGQRDLPRRFMTAMYVSLAIGTLMLVGYGLASETWHILLASFIMHALLCAAIIIWNTTLHMHVPGNILGRVSSLDWFVSTSLIPVSLMIAGPLSLVIGPGRVLVGAGLIGCVALLSFILLPGALDPQKPEPGVSEPVLSHD